MSHREPDDAAFEHEQSHGVASLTYCLAFVLAIGRVWIGMTEAPRPATWPGSYEALSHVFVGGLLVAAVMGRGWQWPVLWGLVIVEVVVATVTRI